MNPSTITLLFLLFAILMFVTEKLPLGLTSMIVCCGLVVTGVLDVTTAFAGFIDSNVILFVAMFIVGGALFETGMAGRIGSIVTRFARGERTLIAAIMIIVGSMSGVLSNTGTAAVLIPVVTGIAAKSGYSRSRLLMPLVFAAAMGGNLSLIGRTGEPDRPERTPGNRLIVRIFRICHRRTADSDCRNPVLHNHRIFTSSEPSGSCQRNGLSYAGGSYRCGTCISLETNCLSGCTDSDPARDDI